jgi:hypothetical protein
MWRVLGGRKSTFVLAAILAVAFRKYLDLDAEAIEQIVYLALGGAGVIAIEDAVGKLRGGGHGGGKPSAKK